MPPVEAAFQTAAVMLRTPSPRRRPLARFPYVARGFVAPAGATRDDPAQPAIRTMSSYRGMDASL